MKDVTPAAALRAAKKKADDREVRLVGVASIEVYDRMRTVDDEAVDALAASMEKIGLRTPISVRHYRTRPAHLPIDDSINALVLIAGAHRLAAAAKLGWEEIECFVYYEGSELDAQLWEIDENLTRSELSPSARASHVARRKEIYEALHPVAKHGGDRKSYQVDKLSTRSFAEETAAVTGSDARTVRRDAERGAKVIPEVLDLIRGTRLDTGTYLDKLKRLPPNEQVHAAKRDLADTNRIEKERAERKARQTEHDRQRQEHAAKLPDHVKDQEAAKDAARQVKKDNAADGELTEADRIADLEEAVRALESENADLNSRIAEDEELGRMRREWREGGWDKVIEKLNADHAEVVRVQDRRIESESADKASWKRSADYWKAEAIKLGWTKDTYIDIQTGEVVDG